MAWVQFGPRHVLEYFCSSFFGPGFCVRFFLLPHLSYMSFGEKMTHYLLVKCFYKKILKPINSF